MRPRPDHVALGAVALLALSLAGVPALLRARDGSGSLRGVVVDGRGFGIAGAAVFLFAEGRLQLVEEARSDEHGDFFLHLEAERPRVYVRPPEDSGLLPAWSLPVEDDSRTLAFVLQPARRLALEVLDLAGKAVAGAEVRVYEHRREAAVLALGESDERGRLSLPAPARADVAVFAPGSARLARWRFDLAVPSEGAELAFVLPPARLVSGCVRSAEGPLDGILLVAWEEGIEGGWNGFTTSDAQGRFALAASDAPTVVRAVDPAGEFLPGRVRLDGPSAVPLELLLERGARLVVRTSRGGLPLGSRVWSWSTTAEAWGWGTRSSATGRATLPVSARFGIHAEPLDPAYPPVEAWDVPFGEGTLHLEVPSKP